jgi:N,N'-diacetyllegionaminate synthase
MFTIAEIGQAHDGSLGILHSYIDALSSTGLSAIKFQTHLAEAESSEYEPFRVNFSYVDETRFDYWKRMQFSINQWKEIKDHCDHVGLEFMSSPFSLAAVDLLEELDMRRYKIGSGEVTNLLMLEKIAKTGKPIILSSGMSSYSEIYNAVSFLESFGNEVSILQCTTSYPTPYEKLGLNVISELKKIYPKNTIGLSDHSGEIYSGIAATVLGAEILEFHAVFDKRLFGPDAKSSLTIDQIDELVNAVSKIERALNNPVDKSNNAKFRDLKGMFEKSLAINRPLNKGDIIAVDDLETKKPAKQGIAASDYKTVLGKKLNKNLKKWSFLTKKDID